MDAPVLLHRAEQACYAETKKNTASPSFDNRGLRPPEAWERRSPLDFALPLLLCGIIFGGIWGFAGVAFSRQGGIVTAYAIASFYRSHRPAYEFTLTLISGIIASTVSYCFLSAVRLFAHRTLVTRPAQTAEFDAWAAMANKRVFKGAGPAKYVSLSVAIAALTLTLTPAIKSVFTLTDVKIDELLSTTELDLTAPYFAQNFDAINTNNAGCGWYAFRNATFPSCAVGNAFPGLLQAGRTTAESEFGLVRRDSVGFRAGTVTFTTSTGGTLPIRPSNAFSKEVQDYVRTSRISDLSTNYTSLAATLSRFNTTVEQQGLTADVSCAIVDTSPLTFATSLSPEVDSGINFIIVPTLTCPSGSVVVSGSGPFGFATRNGGTDLPFVTSGTCRQEDDSAYQVYIRHEGYYKHEYQNLTCTVIPRMTTVSLVYQSVAASFQQDLSANTSTASETGAPVAAMDAIVGVFSTAMLPAQGLTSNQVAESIIGITAGYFGGDEAKYTPIMEKYIRAFIEFQATHLRNYWSYQVAASTTNNSLPTEATRPVQGTLQYTMLGYNPDGGSLLLLIPFTIFCVFTVVLITWSLPELCDKPAFDPTDLGQVMNAIEDGSLFREPAAEMQGKEAWALTHAVVLGDE